MKNITGIDNIVHEHDQQVDVRRERHVETFMNKVQTFPVDIREGVIWAYRHLLRREPVNDAEIAFHLGHTVESMRKAFVASSEYRALSDADLIPAALWPDLERFRPFATESPPPGMWRNFLGVDTRCAFLPRECLAWSGQVFGPPSAGGMSGVHDEVEWIGTLRAILDARDRLTVVELGAGWAPWLVSAATAARRLGICEISLLGLEGSQEHVDFMREHFLDNGLDPVSHQLIHGVVGVEDGIAHFPRLSDPSENYGAEADYGPDRAGVEMEQVPSHALATILRDLPIVDVVHCDIQGMEAKVFHAARDAVNRRVKRVIIGTHGRAVEAELHDQFSREGWVLEADTTCQFTQVGTTLVLLADGTQVWRNPALAVG